MSDICCSMGIENKDITLNQKLLKIKNDFEKFSHDHNDIYSCIPLWGKLNEIGKNHKSETTALIATCASIELCKNFVTIADKLRKSFENSYFQDLFNLVARFLRSIEANDNYIYKYNILRRFVEEEFFRLDTFPGNKNKTVSQEMFVSMFNTLKCLAGQWDSKEIVYQLVILGANQLVDSAGDCVSQKTVTSELLSCFLSENSLIRLLIKKCLSSMRYRHLQQFCMVITRRIILKRKSRTFYGKELEIAERAIEVVRNVHIFDSILFIICREAENAFHPDHEKITRILCALVVRYTERINGEWEFLNLDLKKTIRTMIYRLIKAFNIKGKTKRSYANILIKYGPQLLKQAPTVAMQFQYFKIFTNYMKCVDGEQKNLLAKIFDEHLGNSRPNNLYTKGHIL